MSHVRWEISLVLEPSPNSPSAREAASRAARTGPWPGPDTAAGAYAIASSDERGSSGYPLLLRNRRVRMTTVLDAPHRSVHLPPSLLPRIAGTRNLFICLFRAAIGSTDGSCRPPVSVLVDIGYPVSVHTSRNI